MSSQPTRISRYEIKGLIAQGGMGDLYLARDPNTDRLVALKLLLATLDSADIRGRFEREARALASLNHPNVVHIYDYGDFQGAPFIVMEYVRGETLAEKIKRRAPMPVSEKLRLMVELCAGLTHAHQAGIIHRDVKPANLLVDQDEHLKILDFGIARVGGSNLTTVGTLGTLMNMQIGTPGYMSPEQIEGSEIDQRADVFAAGAVCYELLSNREAFSGGNSAEIERQVIAGQPVPLASLVPGLDPELDAIITRALAKHRDQRYPSAAMLGEALEGCRSRLGLVKTSPALRRQVALPPGAGGMSRGDAAYQRAVDLYEDGARDAARRFACEALAEDPNHAGARALVSRLDKNRRLPGMRGGTPFNPSPPTSLPPSSDPPTAVSEPTVFLAPVDATVLIPRPEHKTVSTAADETVFLPPVKKPLRTPQDDETARVSRPDQSVRTAVADPTVLVKPPKPAQRSTPTPTWYSGVLAGSQSLWTRWRAGRKRPPSPRTARPLRTRPSPSWKQYKRSALIVAALVVMMAGAVLIAMVVGGWSSGHRLTITTPAGGTISSAGIRCGTRGSDCSTTHDDGDAVELSAVPDEGFSFNGFTGDCAPTGRTLMTGPRTCSATFERTVVAPPPRDWPLTIKPPTGGTILAAGGIKCGSFGTACTTNLPDSVPVTLIAQADHGYTFLTFTDECAPTGNTMMTGPRTCGATFAEAGPPAPPTPPTAPPIREPKKPVVGQLPPQTPTPPVPTPPTNDPPSKVPVIVDGGEKVEKVISREEHATKEIQGLIKEYCALLEAMDPLRIQKVYPTVDVATFRDQYRQYKSLKCTTTPPEFVRLDADAGTSVVKVGMKQTLEMKSGGAPKINETIATMTLSRPELRTVWHIGNVRHEAKPKE